jgi:hypothetical protein
MSFLIIEHERYALKRGDTILGGSDDQLLAASPLGKLAPFAAITSGIDAIVTIRALAGGQRARLRGKHLARTPTRLTHGDRLTVAGLVILYGDVRALGQTTPLPGISDEETDLLAQWSRMEVTAPTGGRLVDDEGTEWPIPDAGLLIGRDPECGLVIVSNAVSRRHATITPGAWGYSVLDESTNGVLVNGTRIQRSALLRQGDVVRIGDVDYRFEADAARPPR